MIIDEGQLELIADGLAEHGFAVVDDFLSQEEMIALRNCLLRLKNEGHFKKAGIGKQSSLQIREDIRGDYIHWLERDTPHVPIQGYMNRLEELSSYLNRSLYLGLKDFEIHFAYYPEGTFYQKHSDRFKQTDHRIISVVLYLNTDWQEGYGGQLVLYPEQQSEVKITPIAGRLACFRSEILHEVLAATHERQSVTGWLVNKPVGLGL
jgi:SM-20-related protein